MRNKTVSIGTIDEWKETSEDIYQLCLDTLRERVDDDPCLPWLDETLNSLYAIFEASGVDMHNYSIGAYSPSFIQVRFCRSEEAELSGPRAMAWLENNLLGSLRIPWRGPNRTGVRKYGPAYQPDTVSPCPLTGYCFDGDLIDALINGVADGLCIGQAYEALAQVTQKMLEAEIEYARSDEALHDSACVNGYEFDEEGRMI